MNNQEFSIEHLSEGQFELFPDGTFCKASTQSKVKHSPEFEDLYGGLKTDIGIDPILVSTADTHILLDAGLGIGLDARRADPKVSNIKSNLEIFDISTADVGHVVLSHLHYDHIAGLTYADKGSSLQATLPNATIWVHQKEWEHALSAMDKDNDTSDLPYRLDDFYRLVADGRVKFMGDDRYSIVKGVDVIRTGGHTPGHQIVRIRKGQSLSYYFGDLVPNENFVGFNMLRNADFNPTESRQIKMLLLKQAYHENASILFYHSVHLKQGKIGKDAERQYVLKSIK
jgi:glyoxylase-like metal-dependent hydrolase (beta-lactamase superfamily II)